MKLTGVFPPIKTEKVQVKKSERSSASKADKAVLPTDSVVLSAGSLDVQKAREVIAQTPEVRADKVQTLKADIASGQYLLDPHRIADKMMSSLLSETVVE